MSKKVTMGELMDAAGVDDVDAYSYEEMREKVGVSECKHCGHEYIHGWNDEYCSDACEAAYINEHF